MIRTYRGKTPKIAVSAYIDPSAVVIGDVEIGERVSVWPNVTIRGDVNTMRIGVDTNIQDNSVLHSDDGFPLTIGDRVTVGHAVVLHGCTVEDDVVVGIGATVLNGAKIGKGAVVAARIAGTRGSGDRTRNARDGSPGEGSASGQRGRAETLPQRLHALRGKGANLQAGIFVVIGAGASSRSKSAWGTASALQPGFCPATGNQFEPRGSAAAARKGFPTSGLNLGGKRLLHD